ncbi:hypothetical protein [Novosphingobium sp. CCH12-A3]|nr:hypothetical protein [Novosphingobium sp. CCH12-A3]
MLELPGKGKLDATRLTTHRYPPDRINEAFHCANDKARTGAVFIAVEM